MADDMAAVVAELRRLEKLATPGEWQSVPVLEAGEERDCHGRIAKSWGQSDGRILNGPPQVIEDFTLAKRWFKNAADADLMAKLRNALPGLLAEREAILADREAAWRRIDKVGTDLIACRLERAALLKVAEAARPFALAGSAPDTGTRWALIDALRALTLPPKEETP